MTMSISTSAFAADQKIPARHTGEGEDLSPALSWSGVPAGAKQLALICDDPDAPRADPWVHWVIYRIPASTPGLGEGVPAVANLVTPVKAVQGKNSWGTIGYRGPLPPPGHGTHHYHFKLYALDAELSLGPGADKAELLAAMEGHILAKAELVGTYER